MKELIFIVAILVSIPASSSLSCTTCNQATCQTPTCCDSGYLTKDVCGCCLVCASAEGKACGGLWGFSGTCVGGTRCLTKCEDWMSCQWTDGVCLQENEAKDIFEQMQQNNETGNLSRDYGSGQTQVAICGQPGGDKQPNQAMLCLVVKIILIRIKIFI